MAGKHAEKFTHTCGCDTWLIVLDPPHVWITCAECKMSIAIEPSLLDMLNERLADIPEDPKMFAGRKKLWELSRDDHGREPDRYPDPGPEPKIQEGKT